MRAACTALLVAIATVPAAAQYPDRQPWNGGGVTVTEAGQSALANRKVVAGAVVLVSLTVSDAARSRRFYEEVLTFRALRDTVVDGTAWAALTGTPPGRVRMVRLGLGAEQIELVQYLERPGRPAPPAMASNDRWFQHVAIIVRDIDSAHARLVRAGVTAVSPGPQTLPASIPAAAGISAFYFRDPDGHPLEILSFPLNKGAARWHLPGPELFQGIDHTAIVVGDTERSLGFYERLLGLERTGESFNRGPEQERLNNVAGAELHITGLRAPMGPGVEFLDYRAPSTGRAYPRDARPNDLLHWHTRIAVNDVLLALERARADGYRLVSRSAVPMDPVLTGYRRAVMLRDPDGHAVELVEP
jgi:catechol 2,3-dioxygenase-like lactoylglutathione lyase family enzyme